MSNLYQASEQWRTRPEDERFASLEDLQTAVNAYRASAQESEIRTKDFRVQADGNEIVVVGRSNIPATATHWMFGQLSSRLGAPASYLRTLPPTLAVQNLNYGLARLTDEFDGYQLLTHRNNGSYVARAFMSGIYSRIWDADIANKISIVRDFGWRVAPARPAFPNQKGTRKATAADLLSAEGFGLSINIGDEIAPAGLYASDHDMFIFMVNEKYRLDDGGMSRGFFISNSEVGNASFRIKTFLYRHVCGNHILWDASGVQEIAIRHVGDAHDRAFRDLAVTLTKYATSSATEDEAKIARTKTIRIAANLDELIALVIKKKILNEKHTRAAYEIASDHTDTDGDPLTPFGFAGGITRMSQLTAHADTRTDLDRAAGKILGLVF